MSNLDQLNKVANGLKGKSGCFLIGKIEGVDFTAAGKMENGQTYGSSVKLKFANQISSVKSVNGIDVPTTKYVSQTIKIPVTDAELVSKIGKEVIIELELSDNSSFKTNNIQEIA
jgi:hypothetical protein